SGGGFPRYWKGPGPYFKRALPPPPLSNVFLPTVSPDGRGRYSGRSDTKDDLTGQSRYQCDGLIYGDSERVVSPHSRREFPVSIPVLFLDDWPTIQCLTPAPRTECFLMAAERGEGRKLPRAPMAIWGIYVTNQKYSNSDIEGVEVIVDDLITDMSETMFEKLVEETKKDAELQQLHRVVMDGWPQTKPETPLEIRPYWSYRDEISGYDGLMFKGDRVIVPHVLKPEMLDRIHAAHLGIEKCKARARGLVFWPGMNSAIDEMVSECRTFDYFSKYPEVTRINHKNSEAVILAMKEMFARHGIPEKIIADNMPFNSLRFRDFARENVQTIKLPNESLRRNRQHLMPTNEPPMIITPPMEPVGEEERCSGIAPNDGATAQTAYKNAQIFLYNPCTRYCTSSTSKSDLSKDYR
ncbi:Retrovirus-related Pol poly, partial [Paramuricea clavata]